MTFQVCLRAEPSCPQDGGKMLHAEPPTIPTGALLAGGKRFLKTGCHVQALRECSFLPTYPLVVPMHLGF